MRNGDKDTVKQMMQAIYDDCIPDDGNGEQGYTTTVKCGSDQDDECGPSVLAATSAKPGETTMVFCDRFFSANTVQTKQDLTSKELGLKRGQRCQSDEQFPFFEVAGLTAFHEMTHLHTIGQKAGLRSDDDRDHYKNMEPWQAARELKKLWDAYDDDNGEYKPSTPAAENAGSMLLLLLLLLLWSSTS
ncbi:hypothetical protein SAMD00023353_1302520 [Rosellinia necatrix]|uniref:Lysine-specific metallo-endopeptidase domain-containing protein n=1 Tax=Rosellinia necatrix TaxID=77044 RepID=A0A1W2TC17_ROSNE|nr:hypothetical protein SAMD00023353_1302520 [Rosellinia necatrix]